MKQFMINKMAQGIQLSVAVVCKTRKEALGRLDVSDHMLRSYGYVVDLKSNAKSLCEDAIKNPYVLYAMFDSGELCYAKPEWRHKWMKFTELKNFISDHRNSFPTYSDTVKFYGK